MPKKSTTGKTLFHYFRQYESVGPDKYGNEMLRTFLWNPNSESSDFVISVFCAHHINGMYSKLSFSQVFVYKNNLWYQSDPYERAVQVTTTGEAYVYNGVADWLYEGIPPNYDFHKMLRVKPLLNNPHSWPKIL